MVWSSDARARVRALLRFLRCYIHCKKTRFGRGRSVMKRTKKNKKPLYECTTFYECNYNNSVLTTTLFVLRNDFFCFFAPNRYHIMWTRLGAPRSVFIEGDEGRKPPPEPFFRRLFRVLNYHITLTKTAKTRINGKYKN